MQKLHYSSLQDGEKAPSATPCVVGRHTCGWQQGGGWEGTHDDSARMADDLPSSKGAFDIQWGWLRSWGRGLASLRSEADEVAPLSRIKLSPPLPATVAMAERRGQPHDRGCGREASHCPSMPTRLGALGDSERAVEQKTCDLKDRDILTYFVIFSNFEKQVAWLHHFQNTHRHS